MIYFGSTNSFGVPLMQSSDISVIETIADCKQGGAIGQDVDAKIAS